MTTTQSQSSNNETIQSLTTLRYETESVIPPNRLDRQKIQEMIGECSLLVANQFLQNKFFDVHQTHEANIELRSELIAIQQQLDQLSDKQLTLKLTHVKESIESIIQQYRILVEKESSLIFVSQMFVFSFIVFSALLLLFYCRRCIVTPLNKLEESVRSISNHPFNVNFVETGNEIGFLSTGLKSMSEELESVIQKKVFDKKTALETANESIQFLFTTSQTLSTVRLTHPIIIETLNALAKQTNLSKLCLELVNGVKINSDYGCATKNNQNNKCIPLINNGVPFGYLNYIQATPIAENTSIIVGFSRLLARALYQEEYRLQEQKLLLMDERSVIARELHDSIAQTLSFLKIQCTVLNRQIDADSEKKAVKNSVSNIEEAVSDAYVQLRSLLSTFRLNISESDIKEAVLVMISQLQKQTTAKIQLGKFESSFQTHANQHIHLLQIIREAMINAIKHADCSHIIVNCAIVDQKIIITIADDGIGIKEKLGKGNHYGIEIMNQRAVELNAELEIKNLPIGTEIKLTFEI